MTTSMRWRTSPAAAVALAVALLTGCTATSGNGSSTRAPSSTATGTSTAATTAASSGQPASSGHPAPPGHTATPGHPVPPTNPVTTAASSTNCAAAELSVAGGPLPGGSAAGHTGVLLTFTNHSRRTCTISGYPGVAGLDAGGHQLAQATRTFNGYLAGCRCSVRPSIRLAPHAIASAVTEGNVGGTGNCDTFTYLLVTPPNTTSSTRVDLVPHSCGFTVHPVVRGSTGTP